MANKNLYTVGGAVQVRDGVYISRKADAELLDYCLKGEYVYVLCPRQVGKSSLMYRTAEQLNKKNVRTAIVDLASIGGGTKINEDRWYHDIFSEIIDTLNLNVDLDEWWDNNKTSNAAYRLARFFSDVVFLEIKEQIIIFIDEIDTTLRIKFADDFFIAIRSFYNSRVMKPEFRRLSFVLIGTATPTDFIKEPSRTPFNIGQRVDLADFSFSEALPLSTGLATSKERAREILEWVFEWASGHPYLTQKICSMLSQKKELKVNITKNVVADTVKEAFLRSMQDFNLQFVRTMLLARAKDPRGVMKLYEQVLLGKDIEDSEQNLNKSHLKLSGIVRVVDGYYIVSNKIYENAFNLDWVTRNTPQPKIIVFLAAQAAFILLLLLGYFFSSQRPTYILFAIWAAICLLWTSRLREMLSRTGLLIRKPIVIYKDPEPENVPFYPRTLLEDSTEEFRNSLTNPFRNVMGVFIDQIKSLTTTFNKGGQPTRLFGYMFFLVSFSVFVSTNLAFISDTLVLLNLASLSQRLFPYSFSIFSFIGTLFSFFIGIAVISETRTTVSQLSAWSDRNARNKSLATGVAILSVTLSVISLFGWYFFRLIELGNTGSFGNLTLIANMIYYVVIPLNMLLSAFITALDSIRALIVLLIILEWLMVGLLLLLDISLTILGTAIPILIEMLYRAIYILVDVAQWFFTTPMHVVAFSFRSLSRVFSSPQDEIPLKNKKR